MSLGGGYSRSSSEQASQSSGPLGAGGAATATRNLLADLFGGAGMTGPVGNYGGGVANLLFQRTQDQVPYRLPTLGATGLQPEQQAGLDQWSNSAFSQAVREALGRTSSIAAQRGYLRPENVQAIAGAAAQNVAPQMASLFAPLQSNLATQNLQQRTQAPLVQEDLARQRFADLLNALGLGGALLGGQSTSFGRSSGFGVQASGGARSGGGGSTPSQEGIG